MIVRVLSLLLFCCCVSLQAQTPDPEITPDTAVNSAVLRQWVHSGNPRLVAWGSDFARRRHDQEVIADIPAILQQWLKPSKIESGAREVERRRVALALFDTLIEEKATVPLPLIEQISSDFPVQALLLIQRIPLESSRPLLTKWTFGESGSIDTMRARVAAMILAKNPERKFVHDVLAGTVQQVTVEILSHGPDMKRTKEARCNHWSSLPSIAGWPIGYSYLLQELWGVRNEASSQFLPVASLGEHLVVAYRRPEDRIWTDCASTVEDSFLRHELIAYWVGLKRSEIAWKPEESLDILWTTKEAYQQKLGAFLEEDRARMSATLLKLKEKQLLTEKDIDGTFPQISLRFECHITPCPLTGVATPQ